MIDLYYWPTPNGWKVTIALEEMGLPYQIKYVDIGKGEQFKPDFLTISPNNRMPAMVDHASRLEGGAGSLRGGRARPAVDKGFAIGREEFERIRKEGMSEEMKKVLFGQKDAK